MPVRYKQLRYTTKTTIEREIDTKTANFISQGLDDQKVESTLPSVAKESDAVLRETFNSTAAVSNGATQSVKTRVKSSQEPRPFPFSMIVDQQEIKHALLLSAVDPKIGVLISGGRGTAKSVLCR